MRERLIKPRAVAHAVGKTLRQAFEESGIVGITAAQNNQAKIAFAQQWRQGIHQQIDPLLFGKAGHHADERLRRRHRQLSGLNQHFLVDELAAQILRTEMRAQVRVVSRIPFLVVDTVQYSRHAIRALAQGHLQSHAERCIADFARVRRAHGADRVRVFYAGSQ